MIATGTDVKPLECLLFMRDVKSRNYFEQMKGRGTRVINFDDLKKVSPSAKITKDHFVIVDAIGVTKSLKTDSRPLEKKPGVPLKDLLGAVAVGARDEDLFTSLANRLTRLDKQITEKEKKTFEEKNGIGLGFMSFFVKAVVVALKKFPIINASVDGNDIIYHPYYDIGIAVASPRGLVVPILRNADQLTQVEIEKQIADFVTRAQNGKLTIDELSGGTFSITNGGVFGSMLSTPIINPPQSAILGIHATKERPVVENGQIVIRPMNYLALSYDHRIIDGKEAVLSLVAIKEALEYPMSPLFESKT